MIWKYKLVHKSSIGNKSKPPEQFTHNTIAIDVTFQKAILQVPFHSKQILHEYPFMYTETNLHNIYNGWTGKYGFPPQFTNKTT